MKFDWTPEAIETLRRLTAEGHSASVTGAKMGLSKGAVIGKRSRLGIVAPATKRVPTGLPVTITDLNFFHCKAIIAPQKYCGQMVHRKNFCSHHFGLYYAARQLVAGKARLFA